ncbi:MAG: hypothetical protein RBR05_04550 [Candidatus Methanomethylophilaceae archaeon]|nr:hypothetical protein [Candidatus Methanomethylophilaceae archaeon]MDY0224647.1 hypothetical protein [Candidatus Methanomethylophilaceae archaeon]
METYKISNKEIIALKQTMGFRVGDKDWANYVLAHPEDCTNVEIINFVKEHMNPPYETHGDIDEYLEGILKLFVAFVRN